ncbi:MAG: 3-phosphoshikimate 1-carboxyvinyltransferase [Paraglaciecola psychrophila]
MEFTAKPGGALQGMFRVPGDKSISHRSVMFGSLAQGVTNVTGCLEGDDVIATMNAFRAMGVTIDGPVDGALSVHGVGLHGLKAPSQPLYLGNSGTSMRLLSGLLAGQEFAVTLTGDSSLSKRPMERVAKPLRQMGADIRTQAGGCPPIEIAASAGINALKAIHYDMPVASAQVKSCVLLAGLYADGNTSTTEPAPTRDHTERMLKGFGIEVAVNGPTATLSAGGTLIGRDIDVPADISSAAFFMVAASIAPGSDIVLSHVGINPTRIGVINILQQMGADISLNNEREVGGEPVADIRVRSAQLRGIHIPEDQVPLAIDEFPVLFVAAACAIGTTVLTGAEELRVKESDRIQAMVDGLAAMGVDIEGTTDGAIIQGLGADAEPDAAVFAAARVASCDDHRIAMAFSVAALRASGDIVIEECDNVATSFPNFVELCNTAGMSIEVIA